MPTPWKDVAASPAYQALPPDQQEAARQQYFQQVVAPQIQDPSQLAAAKQQFDAQYAPKQTQTVIMPDGTQSQAAARLVASGKFTPGQIAEMTQVPDPTDGMSGLQKFGAGVGKSIVDTGRGIGQLLGINSQSDINKDAQQDQALANTGAGKAGDFAGQVAQTLIPVGDSAKMLGWAGKSAPYIAAAVKGGAFAGAQPVQEGQSRAVNTALGAGLGVAGQGVASGLGALAQGASMPPGRQAMIDVANQYNIPLHLSQVTDSRPLQTLASAAKYLPFSGSKAAANAQQGAFNRALSQQIGADSDNLSDPVLEGAAKKISQGYNDLFSRNTVNLNAGDAAKLTQIINNASKFGGNDVGQIVGNHVDSIIGNLDQSGSMPGRLFQSIRTDQLNPAQNSANPALSHYLGQVKSVLQDAAKRSMGPDDAAELAKLNGQYNSLKTIQQAVNKRAAGAGGDVAPANLWSLVNGRYGSTPDMRQLAQLGQTVLKDPIPDSGTAARATIYSLLGAGGAVAPHAVIGPAVAGATIGRLLNSSTAAKVIPAAYRGGLNGLYRLAQGGLPDTLPVAAPLVVGNKPVPMTSIAAQQQ